MPRRRKKTKSGGRPILAGFLAGALIVGAAAAVIFFWPSDEKLNLSGLSREEAAKLIARQTEKRLSAEPLDDAGEILSVDPTINVPWSISWRAGSGPALILAEQAVRDLWEGMNPPPQVKVIYPDHSRRGERVRLVAGRDGRALVEVLLLEKAEESKPVAGSDGPRPPRRPPVTTKPVKNPTVPPTGLAVPAPPGKPSRGKARGRIAIIIDDIGNERNVVERLLALPAPVTFAVMPNSPYGPDLARRISEQGVEVMLHLPMEPQDLADNDPGPGALLVSMTPAEIEAALTAALKQVPMARGLNNHMGSAFTADRAGMQALLTSVDRRGLYFIDSRTSPDTQGGALMRQLGVRGGERRVFLDHVASEAETEARLYELARAADAGGVPIGIGHPYPETVAALTRVIPKLLADGYEFVYASEAIE